MTDVIVFIDALSPRETAGVLEEWKQGKMDAGKPRVTPRVMSSIYTGQNPAENGMMEVSKHGGEDTTRPKTSTFIDQASREGMDVLCMGMPFSVPFRAGVDDCAIGQGEDAEITSLLNGDSLGGVEQTIPPQAEMMASVPAPRADMMRAHPDRVFASFRDQTEGYFDRFKENIRWLDPDVAFLGYRLIDSYCHFQHTEARESIPYRQHLIKEAARLCENIATQIDGDLMWFSDHGQTELTEVFRINRWLAEEGYLDYSVDYNFIDTFNEWQGEDHPVEARVENQVTFGQPGVALNKAESELICDDPFDSCLTLLCDRGEFDTEAFRDELLSTGCFRSVDYKWELWDEDAKFYEQTPDIIPDRAEGVFVSGNIHKEPIGMGWYRTGVHDYTACFGATKPLSIPDGEGRDGMILPEQMNDVIRDFMGLEITTSPVREEDLAAMTPQERLILEESI